MKINLLKKKLYIYIYINIWTRGAWPPPMSIPGPAKPKGKQKQNKINNNSAMQKPISKNPSSSQIFFPSMLVITTTDFPLFLGPFVQVSTVSRHQNLSTSHPYSLVFHLGFLPFGYCIAELLLILFCFCFPFAFPGLLGTKPRSFYSFCFCFHSRRKNVNLIYLNY